MYVEYIFRQNTVNASFQITTALLNSENRNVAFVQLCNYLKGCIFTMV